MPWRITIRRVDGIPLGSRDAIKRGILAIFPEVKFYQDPSGPERIEAAEKRGFEFPEALRQSLQRIPATVQGDFEEGGLFVRFFLGPEYENELPSVDAEVRGDIQRSVPLLRRLAESNRWEILESGKPVPLDE